MNTPTTPDVRAEALAVVAYLVTGLARGEPSICFEDERGDYGDEDHTPVFDALVRLSDAESALKARDAEIERLSGFEADALRYRWLRYEHEARDTGETFCVFEPDHGPYRLSPVGSMPGELDAAIDQARATGGETANG